jgi:hypothetical protein
MLCNGNHILRGKHLMILMKIRSIDIFLDRRLLSIVKLFNIFIYIYICLQDIDREQDIDRDVELVLNVQCITHQRIVILFHIYDR